MAEAHLRNVGEASSSGKGGAPTATTIEASSRSRRPQAEENKLPLVVRAHDYFNLVAILVLNTINARYLAWGLGGGLFLAATAAYFVLDTLFIGIWPASVKSPVVILGHHLVSGGFLLIPLHYPQHLVNLARCMLVEINTWLLIAKRNLRWRLLEVLFYASWVVLRNLYYPYLVYVFFHEWRGEAARVGTPWNPILVAPVFQSLLTGLNYYWTLDLLVKRARLKQL